MSNPESAPKIDWAYYKSRVAVPGLVDTFQKNYEGIKIPYPPDNLTSQVVAQETQVKQEIQQFKSASDARINEHQKAMEHLKSLLPYEEMTMEDYRDAFPEVCKINEWLSRLQKKLISLSHSLLWIQSIDQPSGPILPKNNWAIRITKLVIPHIRRIFRESNVQYLVII